jgi:hypothetical protein
MNGPLYVSHSAVGGPWLQLARRQQHVDYAGCEVTTGFGVEETWVEPETTSEGEGGS